MNTNEILLIVLAALAVLLVLALTVVSRRRKRTSELKGTFGSEYDRTVETRDKRRDAERELAERKARHEQLQIRPLSAASRQRYLTAWEGVQSRFIDAPVLALSEADALLTRLMAERGFPTDDLRTQEDMLSVEHTHVLDGFRAGHAIEQANSSEGADTEQVRQGMLHFREVFEELVSESGDEPYPSVGQTDRSREVR
ncbi:MAG: putative secreted protein [Frankiales bacterium]|nr:putative secreted protein [Frankiales bacterium]